MLIGLTEALSEARTRGAGLPAYNVIHLEHAEALVGAAEDAGRPIVLQISENTAAFHGGLAPIAHATRALAAASPARLVLHLDHAESLDLVAEALDLGFTSVMYDGSRLSDRDNRATTARVVERCHRVGVDVEAELGEVGGKDGVHAPGVRTDPDAAARFVTDTGVDALAVAVGSSHAMTERTAGLDLDLIAALAAAVPVPLVLHGSSGVPDDGIVAAVRAGMVKINIATHLSGVFTAEVRRILAAEERLVDSRKYLGPARTAMRAEAHRLTALIAG